MTSHTGESKDAILIEEPASVDDLTHIWHMRGGLYLLPVIDLTGTVGEKVDLDCSKLSAQDMPVVSQVIDDFHYRRAQVHLDFHTTQKDSDKILARLFVSGVSLSPHYSPNSKATVDFNIILDSPTVVTECEKLIESGFLQGKFFDRRHICNGCGGSQFNVREECAVCRSSNLTEDFYLHHFSCAYLGREADFREGEDLICPKCRKELLHFGSDYDKPGTLLICNACGHASSEVEIGFLCLNCQMDTDSESIRTGDIHSYDLTERASSYLRAGYAFLDFTDHNPMFADLPFTLIVELNQAARAWKENKTNFCLVNINYEHAHELEVEHGPRQTMQSRRQFIENLHGVLCRAYEGIRKEDFITGKYEDYMVLHGIAKEDILEDRREMIKIAMSSIRLDIGPYFKVLGPEELV
ncbi:hypothetical protein ACJJI5_11830 [Microbulbifer sp. EKSA008]|uniref:TackOD1 domain-containing metal-binding protein n=1 Tax=Microbulbifer sp. EKSA008 TaxID=3243367 RepID=UPI00404112C6